MLAADLAATAFDRDLPETPAVAGVWDPDDAAIDCTLVPMPASIERTDYDGENHITQMDVAVQLSEIASPAIGNVVQIDSVKYRVEGIPFKGCGLATVRLTGLAPVKRHGDGRYRDD